MIKPYTERVNALRYLKDIISPEKDDYSFAKKLIEIPVDKRYNYLKQKIDEKVVGTDGKTKEKAYSMLYELRPKQGGDNNGKNE